MDGLENHAVTVWRSGDGPLASLRDTPLATRFHAWWGASDTRYIASVYPIDRRAAHAGLPRFDVFILVLVRREGPLRRPLRFVAIERETDKRFAVADAFAGGADEWHVHLLASCRSRRAAAVADLQARHGGCVDTALSA